MILLEKDIKVQVDRGSVSKPENRKTLQEFGKIWKAVYGKLKTSPDKINKYKELVKRISDTTTSSIDELAGIFQFMGKKFRVEVDKSKYSEMRPTPWRIAYVGNIGESKMKKSELRQMIKEEIERINEVKFTSQQTSQAQKDILRFLKDESKSLGLDIIDAYKFITHILTSYKMLPTVAKMRESVDDLNELSFTGTDVQTVSNDILDFLSKESKKLNKTPKDTYKFVNQILNSSKIISKIGRE